MNVLRKVWNKLFRPEVVPDKQLTDALDAVDRAAEEFHTTLTNSPPGFLSHFQTVLAEQAREDAARIRRARKKREYGP